MRSRSDYVWVLALVVSLGLAAETRAAGGDAAFKKSQQLLADGDLAGARQQLIVAVKADRDNQQYLQQYLLVTQAIKLNDAVRRERDPKRWEAAAQSLSLFYTSQGLHDQALGVDQALFDRLKTADAAVQLGETLLAVDDPQRAVEVLSGLAVDRVSDASKAVLCIALVRSNQLDEARRVVGGLSLAAGADPFTMYSAARAHGAVGNEETSLTILRRCYESVPPSRLAALKLHTQACSDFATFVKTPAFSQVLQTQSKVTESQCSGGSSCSTCPMRGNCSSGK